jgi:hypothetical protein
MNPPPDQSSTVLSMSEEEQRKIRQQLRRLLETPLFKNSRRYPVLLRFIVEETLEGRGDLLKERLIGVNVFDRPADYDTAADPVVRVTVAEIRKRIAQYYHDEEHDAEIRIELLPGRYAPEFRFRNTRRDLESASNGTYDLHGPAPESHLPQPHHPEPAPPDAPPPPSPAPRKDPPLPARIALAAAFVLTAFACLAYFNWHRSAADQLWRPVLMSSSPVLICVPTGAGRKPGPADFTEASSAPSPTGQSFQDHQSLGENIVYSDMLATIKVSSLLAIRHQEFRIKLNTDTNLEDLRQGPAILIGGLDNQWTMQALSSLRFHFGGLLSSARYWIIDSQHPAKTDWSLDLTQQYQAVTRDYAIIARIHNEETGQPEIIAAGIGMSGTAAAGEFLTDSDRIAQLRQEIGPNFETHDFEAVLSTDVINGIAGSPKLIAAYSW